VGTLKYWCVCMWTEGGHTEVLMCVCMWTEGGHTEVLVCVYVDRRWAH
jgi:hypothetical protein